MHVHGSGQEEKRESFAAISAAAKLSRHASLRAACLLPHTEDLKAVPGHEEGPKREGRRQTPRRAEL